jgi:ATP-dependent Clp protease ATP-binding subunit ClpC
MKRTPRVEQAVHRAELLAESLGDDFIGTEHLLLALAQDPNGIASQVLAELGVREELQKRLRAILESDTYNAEGRSGDTSLG